MTGGHDMTVMYAMHDALRRELEHLDRATVRLDDDPRTLLRTAAGWELFKRSLRVHHAAEDDVLLPALRENLSDRPDELALLEVMDAEHAAVDEVVRRIDAALAHPEAGLDRLGDLVDALVTGLAGHLGHEEEQALPLVRAVATPRQWAHFDQVHGRRIGSDAPHLLPWLLDGADERTVASVLARLPAPVRTAYNVRWRHAYAEVDLWRPRVSA